MPRESLNSLHVVIQLAELGSHSLLGLFCSIMRNTWFEIVFITPVYCYTQDIYNFRHSLKVKKDLPYDNHRLFF